MIFSTNLGRNLVAFAASLVVASISLLAAVGPAANPGLLI
jgi:hypothetical protein